MLSKAYSNTSSFHYIFFSLLEQKLGQQQLLEVQLSGLSPQNNQ